MKGIANSLGDSSFCCAPFRMTNLNLLDISLLFELIQPLVLHHFFLLFHYFSFFRAFHPAQWPRLVRVGAYFSHPFLRLKLYS